MTPKKKVEEVKSEAVKPEVNENDIKKSQFIEEYKLLSEKYSLDFFPVLAYVEYGVIPRIVIKSTKQDEPVQTKQD